MADDFDFEEFCREGDAELSALSIATEGEAVAPAKLSKKAKQKLAKERAAAEKKAAAAARASIFDSEAPTQAGKPALPPVMIEQLDQPHEWFADKDDSGARLANWWGIYSKAFKEEHEWLEARGESTSRSMGIVPERMVPLIFGAEAGTKFKRVCFIAHRETDQGGGAIGFATVDIDPDVASVCHLRMLLVDPDSQRQGVGLAMLEHISRGFPGRHLGLKFARCHSYEKLYGRVGFKKLGDDELYTFMALRRQ